MTNPPSGPVSGPGPGTPPPLTVAVSLAGLEGVVLVLYGLAEIASVSSTRVTMGVTTAGFFALYGAGLVFCAWQVHRRESWARGPLAMAQLIQLGLAWSFRGEGTTWLGVGAGRGGGGDPGRSTPPRQPRGAPRRSGGLTAASGSRVTPAAGPGSG